MTRPSDLNMSDSRKELDLDRLRRLGEQTNGLIFGIIDQFAESLLDRLAVMDRQLEQAESRRLCHQIKGSAANCGFRLLAERLETASKQNAPNPDELKTCARRSIMRWKTFLETESAQAAGRR